MLLLFLSRLRRSSSVYFLFSFCEKVVQVSANPFRDRRVRAVVVPSFGGKVETTVVRCAHVKECVRTEKCDRKHGSLTAGGGETPRF